MQGKLQDVLRERVLHTGVLMREVHGVKTIQFPAADTNNFADASAVRGRVDTLRVAEAKRILTPLES